MGLPAALKLPTALRGDTFGPIIIAYTGPTLAGATVIMTIRKSVGPSTQVLSSAEDEITITGTTTGTITVLAFKPTLSGQLQWDLQVTYADGAVRTLFRDSWTVVQDWTSNV